MFCEMRGEDNVIHEMHDESALTESSRNIRRTGTAHVNHNRRKKSRKVNQLVGRGTEPRLLAKSSFKQAGRSHLIRSSFARNKSDENYFSAGTGKQQQQQQ